MNRLRFDQLFAALPSPHMILDRNLVFAAANEAYEKVTMRHSGELIGRALFEAFPSDGDARRRLEESIRRVFDTGASDTLAYIEYDIPRPVEQGGGIEKRYWTAVHTPLFEEDGTVAFVLQNTVDITELVRLRTAVALPGALIPGELALVQRAREIEEAYYDTLSQVEEFHHLFEQAPGMVAVLQGPNHIFTFVNEAYRQFAGDRELNGLSAHAAFPDLEGQRFFELLDQVFQTGEARSGSAQRVLLTGGNKGVRELYLDFSYHPIRDRQGTISGIFVQGYDRTESVRSHHRQRLLIDELNHRVKNTLSTVQSLARRSFRTSLDREEARRVFEARILALSNAHNLLSEQHWESADLRTILRLELEAIGSDRVEVSGQPMSLNPKAAIAMAMVFHELASNAVKYGAFSVPSGSLHISWHKAGNSTVFTWREVGPVDAQIRPGFGMRMLERIVTGELEGHLSVDTASGGLIWTLEIPTAEIEETSTLAHV